MTQLINAAIDYLNLITGNKLDEESPKYLPDTTGLTFDIWVGKVSKHRPRIKISNKKNDKDQWKSDDESLSIVVPGDGKLPYVHSNHDIKQCPKERIGDAIDWATVNRKAIHKFCNDNDEDSFLRSLKDIGGNYMHPDHIDIENEPTGIKIKSKRKDWDDY